MAVGRVIKFDEARGYGFIAPTGGGEDIFLHVNDLLVPESVVRPGVTVEFQVEEGGRGLKAFGIRLADSDAGTASAPSASAPSAAPAVSAPPAAAAASAASADPVGGDDSLCDVLTVNELTAELTEALLPAVPSLTAEQILAIRGCVVEFARNHGWTEG